MILTIGQKAEFTKTISKEDVFLFAQISGDINPLHLDEKFASKTIFEKPIAHGILSAGLISSVIANILPGEGSIYLEQYLKFLAPVYHGDTLTASVEIIELIYEKKQILLRTDVFNQEKKHVITGNARVKNPNLQSNDK